MRLGGVDCLISLFTAALFRDGRTVNRAKHRKLTLLKTSGEVHCNVLLNLNKNVFIQYYSDVTIMIAWI